MTRKRPSVQPCGERHEPYLHCLTCNPPPLERPERLQGPEIGPEYIYRSRSLPDGVRCVVVARSYVWAPGDPAYRGGSRRYDWKVIRILEDQPLPPFFGSRGLCVDDADLSPVEPFPPPSPCEDFAPDTLGDTPAVCTGCLWHQLDHAPA